MRVVMYTSTTARSFSTTNGSMTIEIYSHLVSKHVGNDIKNDVLAECIFLTHNEGMHEQNVSKENTGRRLSMAS